MTPRRIDVGFAFAVVAASGFLLWLGASGWFIFDDWMLLGSRLDVLEAEGVFAYLFRSHANHLMTTTILWQNATVKAFGLDSYLPTMVMVAMVHAGIAVLVRLVLMTLGIRRGPASAWAVLLMIWGPAFACMLWGMEAAFALVVGLVLLHLLLVDHDEPVSRRDAAGSVVGLVAILTHTIGVLGVVATGLMLARRRRWRAVVIAAVPLVPYALWWVTFRQRGEVHAWIPGDRQLASAPIVDQIEFVAVMWSAPLSGVLPRWGALAVTVAAILMVLSRVRADERRFAVLGSLLIFASLFSAATAHSRAALGADYGATPRYAYVMAVAVLPFFALALQQLADTLAVRSSDRVAATGLFVVLGSLGATHLAQAFEIRDDYRWFMDGSRAEVHRVVHQPDLSDLPGHPRVHRGTNDLNVEHVRRLVRMGLLPVDPPPPADELVDMRRRLLEQ